MLLSILTIVPALPLVPWIVSGLGALGLGAAATASRAEAPSLSGAWEDIKNFGKGVQRGASMLIGRMARATDAKGTPSAPAQSRYVAPADVTAVRRREILPVSPAAERLYGNASATPQGGAAPQGGQPAQPAQPAAGSQPATGSSTGTSTPTGAAPANPDPGQNQGNQGGNSSNNRKPSFRERLGDRIAGRSNGQATGSGGTTPPDNQNGSFIGRLFWETRNNNFGQNYWQWRNVGRVGLGASYPAREYLWPAVGRAGKYMIMGPDSVPATNTVVQPAAQPAQPAAAPVDSSYFAPQQVIAPTDTLDF